GQVKRPYLRKEWSFFFDCITRAFGKKITNWDAIPLDSLQIGYSLLYGSNFDFGRLILMNIGEKLTESSVTVYFARFCQILFNACLPNVLISDADAIQPFKCHKRVFTDRSQLRVEDVDKQRKGKAKMSPSKFVKWANYKTELGDKNETKAKPEKNKQVKNRNGKIGNNGPRKLCNNCNSASHLTYVLRIMCSFDDSQKHLAYFV
ncbi:hypothetical protein ACR2XN_28815, partial [Klebsiella pneumoniae]